VTPFDPWALLAMLNAFYPIVSVANLQRARQERPEYFAGGRLGGSKGEKLFLPDGRVWDLIYAAGGPASAMRWTIQDVTDAAPGAPDPFPLEDGPLAPLDETIVFPMPGGGSFVSLVAGELEAFGDSDGMLARAAVDATEGAGRVNIEPAFSRLVGPAHEHHHAMRQALDNDDPAEELEAAGLTRDTIDATITEYDEEPPDDLNEPDPGDPPRDDSDDDGPPGKERPQ